MDTTQIALKMVFDRWNGALKYCDTLINSLTDEQLQQEIAPGKNRGIYLLGHLVAVHDDMIILLGLGDKLFPQYHVPFIKSADKVVPELPSAQELRAAWTKMNTFLEEKFNGMDTQSWFERHTAVSEEDFASEPHRNKLNIIITRTTHLTYHTGQMVLLKPNS